MNVLTVRSINRGISTFIEEQVQSLKNKGISIDYFNVEGTGKSGYLKNALELRQEVKKKHYDIIHAHVGLSGLLANFQRKVPVITTFHGSDVNLNSNIKYSKAAAWLSAFRILTNRRLNKVLKLEKDYAIIPCGIDLDMFKPMDRAFCKQQMGLDLQKDYILFASSYGREEKNAALARQAVSQLPEAELIELKGYTREEVNLLINASRLVLMTSHYESSPLIIKEALACNCPVISTDVGDVATVIANVEGSYIIDYDAEDVVQKCRFILDNSQTYDSREAVEKFGLPVIADQIMEIYVQVAANNETGNS